MYSVHSDKALPLPGFPIRKSPDQSLFNDSPKLIAVYRVLHRLSLPRHPPYALSSLTIKKIVNQSILPVRTQISRFSCLLQILYAIVKEHYYRFEVRGLRFEVLSSFLSSRSSRLSFGGGERVRTDDPLRARQVLSQLSYTPNLNGGPGWTRTIDLTIISRVL